MVTLRGRRCNRNRKRRSGQSVSLHSTAGEYSTERARLHKIDRRNRYDFSINQTEERIAR